MSRFWSLLLMIGALSACQSQPEWRRRADLLLRDPRFPRPAEKGARCLTDQILAEGLRAAVHSAAFAEVWDYGPLYGDGCPSEQRPECLPLIGPVGQARFPQLDLSVIAFNRGACAQPVIKATVVFDRMHPDGVIGQHDPRTLELTNIRFHKWDETRFNGGRWTIEEKGQEKGQLVSGTEVAFDAPYPAERRLGGGSPSAEAADFMSPWPASVFKLMVATRILTLLDRGKTADEQPLGLETAIPLPTQDLVGACPAEARVLSLRQALETMLQWSGNCATAGLVRFLHAHQEIAQSPSVDAQGYPIEAPSHNSVNALLAELGLSTLQMNRTIEKSGRWGNPADNYDTRTASVANNHMTSWDTARLLWLFDELADSERPRWEVTPGKPVDAEFMSSRQRQLLREVLRDSWSGSGLANNRTCVSAKTVQLMNPPVLAPPPEPGIPALLSAKWLDGGRLRSPFRDHPYPNVVDGIGPSSDDYTSGLELSSCQQLSEVEFLNKAGLTNVAGSSVGIVRGLARPKRRFSRHYIVSFFSSLGARFADGPRMKAVGLSRDASKVSHVSTTQAIPRLGANLDAWLALWLEAR